MTASLVSHHIKRLLRAAWSVRALELLLGLGALGGALAILLTAGDHQAQATKQHHLVQRITAGEVQRQQVQRSHRFAGVVRASQRAHLAFTVAGRLAARPVQIGQRVRKGQVLARLDARAYHHGLGAATARREKTRTRLIQARRDLRRTRILAQQGVVPKAHLDQAESQVKALTAVARAARVQVAESWRTLKETTLRAPFGGVITDIRLHPGEFATPGRPVLFLSGDDALEVRVEVPESVMLQVTVGQQVTVDLPLLGRRALPGRVRHLGRATAGPGRLFPVVAGLDPSDVLKAGMTAEVVLIERRGKRLTAPVAAVVNPSGRQAAVYRIRQGRARRISVQVGALVGARIELRGNLRAGDRVAVSGNAELLDGDRVQVAP